MTKYVVTLTAEERDHPAGMIAAGKAAAQALAHARIPPKVAATDSGPAWAGARCRPCGSPPSA